MVALGQDPLQLKQEQRNCMTLVNFFTEKYLPFAKVNKRSWKSDVSLFSNHIQPTLGRIKINQITASQIREFLYLKISNGFAKGTANRMLYLISRMFSLAIEWDLTDLKKNPAKGIKSFEENNKIERYVSPEEASAPAATESTGDGVVVDSRVPAHLIERSRLAREKWTSR